MRSHKLSLPKLHLVWETLFVLRVFSLGLWICRVFTVFYLVGSATSRLSPPEESDKEIASFFSCQALSILVMIDNIKITAE